MYSYLCIRWSIKSYKCSIPSYVSLPQRLETRKSTSLIPGLIKVNLRDLIHCVINKNLLKGREKLYHTPKAETLPLFLHWVLSHCEETLVVVDHDSLAIQVLLRLFLMAAFMMTSTFASLVNTTMASAEDAVILLNSSASFVWALELFWEK